VAFLCYSSAAPAVFTAKLEPAALAAWEKYIARAEREIGPAQPLLNPSLQAPILEDLNSNGESGGADVPGGYIHHWIGAILIPNASVSSVRGVLEDYPNYPRVYAPDVKLTWASRLPQAAASPAPRTSDPAIDGPVYDVHLITERSEALGLHFAFDVRSHVSFRSAAGFTLIDSRSYDIRESKSAKPPYTDLMPAGEDHGVLWRLNSYWRLRQSGSSVYAELRVISLSRKPWVGLHDRIKAKARESLAETLRQTRVRVEGLTSGVGVYREAGHGPRAAGAVGIPETAKPMENTFRDACSRVAQY